MKLYLLACWYPNIKNQLRFLAEKMIKNLLGLKKENYIIRSAKKETLKYDKQTSHHYDHSLTIKPQPRSKKE